MIVGVLALQGAFAAHRERLIECGVEGIGEYLDTKYVCIGGLA